MSVNNITVCPHCNLDMELKMAPYEKDGIAIPDDSELRENKIYKEK